MINDRQSGNSSRKAGKVSENPTTIWQNSSMLLHKLSATSHLAIFCSLFVSILSISTQDSAITLLGLSTICFRGGVRTIPACNAARRDLLHIINSRHDSFILRLAVAVFTTQGEVNTIFKCLFSHCFSGNKTSLDEYISSYYSLFFEARFGLVPGGLSWIHTAC